MAIHALPRGHGGIWDDDPADQGRACILAGAAILMTVVVAGLIA